MTLPLPWRVWPETRRLEAAFAHAGVEFRYVGGAVRDALLGRAVTDVDIATPARPDSVTALLHTANIKTVPTGIAHGTVTAVVGGKPFEITTLRRDVSCDGRHADVEFTDDWREDAARRDFTMNALFADTGGNVTDYFGGMDDARAGRVRFIGNATDRIQEDALRILRFFRFHAHYGQGAPGAAGLAACASNAGLLSNLSGERIQKEMLKLLAAQAPAATLAAMAQNHILLHAALTEAKINILETMVQADGWLNDISPPLTRLAALMTGWDITAQTALFARWKCSNAQADFLSRVLNHAPILLTDSFRAVKQALRRYPRDVVVAALRLNHAHKPLGGDDGYKSALHFAHTWDIPVFPVTGANLLARGYESGPDLGAALAALEARWEESDYTLGRDALLKTISP